MRHRRIVTIAIVAAAVPIAVGLASSARAYTDQGTAHVQLDAHAKALAEDRRGVSKEIVDAYADPRTMWNDNGNWGAHLYVEYVPLWSAGDEVQVAQWDCVALSPTNIYCETVFD